jgi:hypothetical protein
MKYVKLTVKEPSHWFKPGTEVYDYNEDYDLKKRITLEEWEKSAGKGICVRGMMPNGDIDGEFCSNDEFDVEIIDL